jgi:phospholipid/cholesterol/gamma-HCH transport system substrate-binding protein
MRTAIRKHLGDFVAIAVLFAIGLGVTAYIISQQAARGTFPLIEKSPYELKAEFSDAQAVIPGQGQTVRVAGVEVGKIGTVEPKNGVAVVTMELDRDKIDNHELDIRRNASAQLRPRTGLKDMFIELDPGSGGRRLKEHDTIPVQNTEPDVDPDEILSALDTDTRSYLQLLINGLGKGFAGHGKDLNATFKALGPTQRDLKRVTQAISTRHHELARLVHNYADLTNTLAEKDSDIQRLITASNQTLGAFAQENQNISSAVSKLPSTLRITASTLRKVDTFSRVAKPALQSLRAPFRQLDVANHAVRPFVKEAYPITKNQIRPFVKIARPYVQDLRPAARGLAKATPDLSKSIYELNRFFNMAAFNPGGKEPVPNNLATARRRDEGYLFWVGWVGHLTDSIFSTSDSQGPFRRVLLGFTCDTLRAQVNAINFGPLGSTLGNALLSLPDLTAPTGVCSSTKPPLPTLSLPSLPLPKNAAKAAPGKTGQRPGYNPGTTTTTDTTPTTTGTTPTTTGTTPEITPPDVPTPNTGNGDDGSLVPHLRLPKLKLGLR